MNEIYEIRDPIHGLIQFNELERRVINHPVFQRLRDINQLAWTHYVYPGGTHKRFEHSIGVMHLASRIMNHLYYDSPDKNTTLVAKEYLGPESDFKFKVQLFRLAALVHDIGHLPFSHSGESLLKPHPTEAKSLRHEDYSDSIIRHYLPEVLESSHDRKVNQYNITAKEIADTYAGKGQANLLSEILSGPIDADRCDYLLRDSLHLGVEYGRFDLDRLINTLVLHKGPQEDREFEHIIFIDEDGTDAAFSMLMARYLMFSQVYYHKTRRVLDMHFTEAMKDILKDEFGEETFPGPDQIGNYIKLDDTYVLTKMKQLKDRSDHCRRLLDRNHYRLLGNVSADNPKEENAKVVECLRTRHIPYFEDSIEKSLYEKDDLLVRKRNGTLNPIQKVRPSLKLLSLRFERVYVPKERRTEVETWRPSN